MKKNGYDFEDTLPYQIDYTANFNKAFRREFQNKFVKDDLSADECAILIGIHRNPTITQSGLGKFLFKGKAHIGKILNDMEERGLVKRIADTQDNIIVKRNIITPKGLEIIKKNIKEIQRIKTVMENEFTQDEIEQFVEFLKKYRKVLSTIVDVKLK